MIPDQGLFRMKWEYERERTGYEDLLCFGTADMDFASPQPVLDALRELLDQGHLGYSMLTDTYYDAIHDWLLQKTGWEIDPRPCVSQNVGIYVSVWNILDALTNPGEKVVILTPVHSCFKKMLDLNRRFAVECELLFDGSRYTIDYGALEACFASGSRILWMCNPHNPVGRVWSREELQKIAELCIRYNVLILSDDVYCGLLFDEAVYTPIASLSKEISYRCITMYSPSKTYNLTGLKHSYVVSENPELMKKYRESLGKLDLDYGMSIMGIRALIAAYSSCDDWLDALMRQIQKNYRFVRNEVQEHMPGCVITESEATYFAWMNVSHLGMDPQQICYLLEQEEHLVTENGARMGKGGNGFIRLNLAASEENLQEGMRRLCSFWQRHMPKK